MFNWKCRSYVFLRNHPYASFVVYVLYIFNGCLLHFLYLSSYHYLLRALILQLFTDNLFVIEYVFLACLFSFLSVGTYQIKLYSHFPVLVIYYVHDYQLSLKKYKFISVATCRLCLKNLQEEQTKLTVLSWIRSF